MTTARIGVVLVLLTLALTGCSAMRKPDQSPGAYDQFMQQADALDKAHDIEGAKALYHKAAAADPTQAHPWYQLAQLNFDQKNYGRAIVNAQEVLKRNPSDSGAESILTIAGLRVAVEALSNLHDESDANGPAHVEAEKLAAKMRQTLGQNVLIPPAEKKPKHRHRRKTHHYHHTKPTSTSKTKAAPKPQPTASTEQPKPPAASGLNPFQSLPSGN